MPPKKTQSNVIMPFSEAFEAVWQLWKDYKWESHKFKYKGVISEQVAIQHIVDLSGGEEEKAKKIIFQSIRREWQGLFPLHETTTGNGKSGKKQSATKKGDAGTSETLTERVIRATNEKFNGSGSTDNGSNLKAV